MMDGSFQPRQIGEDRAWITRTDAALTALMRTQRFGRVEADLLAAISAGDSELGHPPPLSHVFWSIVSHLPKPGKDAAADKVRRGFKAFQSINLCVFQTLQRETAFGAVLARTGLTPARLPTPIWLDWLGSVENSPMETATGWLDARHRDHGLGGLFGRDVELSAPAGNHFDIASGAEIFCFPARG